MSIKQIEIDIEKIISDLNEDHENQYQELEKAIIPNGDNINILLKNIKKNFDVPMVALKKAIKLKDACFLDNSFDPSIQYRIVKYLRSVIYCGNYICMPSKKFGELLDKLTDVFKIKDYIIRRIFDMSKNTLTDIKNEKRNISVIKQMHILMFYHDLCYDELNSEIEELSGIRKLLETILGYNTSVKNKEFYREYFRFFDDAEKEKSELSKLTGIRPDDLSEIINDIEYPYYPKQVHNLTKQMSKRIKERISGDEIDESISQYAHRFSQMYLEENVDGYIEGYIHESESDRKAVGDWFIPLPDSLKELVYEFAIRQSNITEDDGLTFYYEYILRQNTPYYYGRGSHQSLILDLIQQYRKLSDDEKEQALEYLHKSIITPLPTPSNHVDYDDCFLESAVFSFFISSLTKYESLSERCKNTPKNENSIDRMLFIKEKYRYIMELGYNNLNYLKKALDFTSAEWQLAGYIEASIANNIPLRLAFIALKAEQPY